MMRCGMFTTGGDCYDEMWNGAEKMYVFNHSGVLAMMKLSPC